MKARSWGKYYDLQPVTDYDEKCIAVRLRWNGPGGDFTRIFMVDKLAGIYQYRLSQAQIRWLKMMAEPETR